MLAAEVLLTLQVQPDDDYRVDDSFDCVKRDVERSSLHKQEQFRQRVLTLNLRRSFVQSLLCLASADRERLSTLHVDCVFNPAVEKACQMSDACGISVYSELPVLQLESVLKMLLPDRMVDLLECFQIVSRKVWLSVDQSEVLACKFS